MKVGSIRILAFLVALHISAIAVANDTEQSTAWSPEQILGSRVKGENYRLEGPVIGDGFLHNFRLQTEYGVLTVRGRRQLENRLKELAALRALRDRSQVASFGTGIANAAISPFRFAGKLLVAPVQTVEDTVSGVGEWFDRVNSGINNAGKDPDGLLSSALGVSKGKRELAFSLGVDPYTDFKPLADRLTNLAEANAAGEFAVNVALTQVPGTAGVAATGLTTASNVNTIVRDKTVSQLRDINRLQLLRLGVNRKTAEQFLDNRLYTPSDQTALVSDITRLSHVGGLNAYVARLATAPNRDIATFQRQRAEHLAIYDAKVSRLTEFVFTKGFPFNRTATGRLVGVFPLDEFAWTSTSAKLVQSVTEDLRRRGALQDAEFRITGLITPLARHKLVTYGWKPVGLVQY